MSENALEALWRPRPNSGHLGTPPAPKPQRAPWLTRWAAFLRLRCPHSRLTWPQSRWIGPAHSRRQVTTQCCLGCGREFEYRGELI